MGLTTLCYLEKDDRYLMLHRIKKEVDVNKDKWIGVGGHFEKDETPEECLLREVKEETGLTLTSWRFRGLVTFLSDAWETEYMCLYTADGFEGDMITCDEGTLEWVKKSELERLNLWEGDKIFFKLLKEEHPFFSLKLKYRGDVLTDKENAGAALLDACKEVKGSEPVQIGSYRGFTMSVEFSAWKQEYTLLLKGQMTHRASLGTDPRGNLTRIDNALAQMPQRLEAVKNQLDNLYQQQAAAKEEIGKPFPFEDDLRVKSARLVELDTLLNIDGKGHAQPETVVAKSARPSVLDSLKRPVPPRSPEKKPKQHEEVR